MGEGPKIPTCVARFFPVLSYISHIENRIERQIEKMPQVWQS